MSRNTQPLNGRLAAWWFGGLAGFVALLLLLEPIAAAIGTWWFVLLLGIAIGAGAGPSWRRLRARVRRQKT